MTIIKKKTFILGILILLIGFFINSCKQSNPFAVDVSGVPDIPVEIMRYEVALFTANPYDLLKDMGPYMEEFSFFLGDGLMTEEGQKQLFDFVTDRFLQELYYDVMEKYPDLDWLEEQLSKAFRYYRYYYPEEQNPRFYSYVSGIDYMMPVKYAEGHLIIGMDMYLGRDYLNYERAGIPVFKRISYTSDHILADVMKVMAEKNMPDDMKVPDNFLDFMIHEGKLLYFLDLMLPETPDSIKIAYSSNQMQWAKSNTRLVWTYFIDNELVFSKDRHMIKQFIGDAPFTVIFGGNSAPRIGAWIGWQIVREYMKNNSNISLHQLLTEKTPREILNKSAFKPR